MAENGRNLTQNNLDTDQVLEPRFLDTESQNNYEVRCQIMRFSRHVRCRIQKAYGKQKPAHK